MKSKTTIKDVAKAAGVSIGLASMIINGKAPAKCKKRDAVLREIERLHYIPNKSAAELRQGIRKKIGVITPDLSNHYFSEVSRNIENVAYDNGYIVLFGSSDDSPAKFASVLETFVRDGVCGLIVTPCNDAEECINNAVKAGIPVVLMNRDLEGTEGAGKVFMDNELAIRMALEYLERKGYRKIAMVTDNAGISTQKLREKVFVDEIEKTGSIPLVKTVPVQYDAGPYSKAIMALKKEGADAILVPKGYLALHVFKAIKVLGFGIPEDFAIVGFDGGLSYELVSPSITQVDQSTKETAEKSFRMICDMIENPGSAHTELLEPTIKAGESA